MKNNSEFAVMAEALRNGRSAVLTKTIEGKVYQREFRRAERLVLLGAGHVSQATAELAAKLGFSVTVVDDRPEFADPSRFPQAERIVCNSFTEAIGMLKICANDYVCVLTRGHRWDAVCMRELLRGEMPLYLGMIGSRRRTSAQLEMFRKEGFDEERIGQIHTPIGIPIKALTPMEIAVSICGELILTRRSRPKDEQLLERTDADEAVLRFITENQEPKAFLMVLESDGSTPGKAGSIMAVDCAGHSAGTIGGGSCEAEALDAARRRIRIGGAEVLSLSLANDAAADEGMACGGTMKILIEQIPAGEVE